ncbi:bifunctional metallophosphatase/5'-nucleotidase [Roseateles sp. DAIF2]|uniref:bifunctional metallophosphatase/5'-nucleotidase n=1 Tax=Roseateles sp. DAIF2 TaxID=2714952 RepID=UPI0018A327F5|nr:bifunctional metallophosphatase/5'-nucleotidase [Roseateles sp. DAIF2]QPF74332.1 bifunctional metallophosphatase/5'-nucleotidase [Roseateles sp. DAIF2]
MPLSKIPRPSVSTLALATAALVLAGCASQQPPQAPAPTGPVAVKVLAINDFHGNLKPAAGGIRLKGEDPKDPNKLVTVAAGGAEHLHTAVAELRRANPNHIFVAAGDLIGGSPLLSALFHDEPTVESLGLMGLDVAAVGNHEFDGGIAELLRKQYGGCHPKEGCKGPAPFKGAKFQYLAASTWDLKTGKTVLPPYYIKSFNGIPMAFIGLTLKGTPEIVTPAGVAGLRFDDEAETVNKLVPELKAKGIEAIALLIHEGGLPTGGPNECPGISGPIVDIVKKLDKAVDFVVSGHTHRAYTCQIDGRLVTSGDKYGTLITEIDLQLDPKTRDVISSRANNVVVRTERYAKDPAQTALIKAYEDLAAPLANRVIGAIAATVSREPDAAGATAMGQLVADAQLAASSAPDKGGAVIALMNIGGVREALTRRANGQVTYGDVFTVQPFSNNLVTLSLSGDQIRRLLEQQWRDAEHARGQMLQVSRGFAYTWDAKAPLGARVVPGSLSLNGQPLDMAASYRVTVNSFVASGGDGFRVLTEGKNALTGLMDVDALELYIAANPNLGPAPLDRVKRVN